MENFLPAVQLDDNLAGAVVVNLLEFTDVAWERCQYVAKD
jgi:hypothetical protein